VSQREIIPCLLRHALACLLAVAPLLAAAQPMPGVDLTDEPPRPSPPRPAPPPAAPAPPRPEPAAPDVLGTALGAPGERDAALADRVKAVQRKGFLKRGRWELTLDLPASLNDAFYQKVGVGGRLAYHVHDSFAVALRGAYWWTLRTDHVREGQAAFQSQLLSSKPFAQAMVDGIWSPVYGKASWLGRSIVHFDLYLLAGLGAVWSDTSIKPRQEGPHPAADLGAGIRFYPRDWLALEMGFTGTFYPDRPTVTAPSTMSRILAAHVGASVFWPLAFEYVYP